MQYELYIDVFFLVNFMMDYILLMLLRKMLASGASHIRAALGAALGAALTCLVVAVPLPGAIKLLLLHGAVNAAMLKAGLSVPWGRPLVRGFIFLYAGSFLLGGILGFMRQYVRVGSLFFALSLLGYFLASGLLSLMEGLARYNRTHLRAVLYREGKALHVKALLDTGNRLRDERTGKPVSIIGAEAARELGFLEAFKEAGKVRYIPYHSIGKREGALPLFEVDSMCLISGQKKVEVGQALLAVCGEELGSDDYGMILNPDVF